MMTSSGSGSYRVGGSMSSSNLSPLAPPFKVDRSLPKPNSANPSVNFSDVPMYGACFDPAPGTFWNSSSSSTSGPKCVATESVVTNANCSSSTNLYGYRDPQSSTSPASVFYGSTNAVSAYEPFSYDPFPNSITSNTNDVTKPYYPPYISPPPQKDGYLGLGVSSEPGYDLLSYSGSAHLNGCGSSQVDPQQTMSGDKSKWCYSWSGLNDSEHGKWTDYDQGFVPKDLSSSNLSSNKSSLFVDGSKKSQPFVDVNVRPFVDGSNNSHLFVDVSNNNHLFDDVSNMNHIKQGACLTQDIGLHGQVSTVNAKEKYFDIFGGAYGLGSLCLEQQGFMSSSECSNMRTSASASASVSKESPHLQEPVLESISSLCSSQEANGSSPEDHFSQAGFYMFGCASTTSTFPISMTKIPYVGSRSSVESTPSAAQLNSMSIDAAGQSNTAAGYNSCQTEAQIPLGLKCQSSIRIRRPVPSTVASSCQIGETADCSLDDKVASEKIKFSPQPPLQLSLHCLNMESSDAEAVYTVEKHSGGSDGHNPAEDSPCWKGASSNRFSPFGHSESVDSDVLVKTIDRCRSLNSQDLQNNGPLFDTLDSKDFSSGKVNEATSLEKPSVSDCTLNDYGDCGSSNPKPCRFDLNAGDGLHFADDCHASMMECNMIDKSKVDVYPKISVATQVNRKGELSSARNISEAPISEKSGNKTPFVTENLSGLSSNIENNLSNSLPGNKSSLKSAGEDQDSRIDVNMLLRTMMNLSEIFRCHCFSNRAEVVEKHAVAVKQIVRNLNASMLLMSGQTIPTPLLSSPDNFFQKEFPVVQMVNDAEALAASFKDDGFPLVDANMTEAVKKLISENLQEEEEEMDEQKLLYKNLWLEAEASLCVMTAKARFLRMKTEMKKTHDGTKDRDNPTSSNAPGDLLKDVELAIDEKDSQSLGEAQQPNTTGQHNHIKVFHNSNSQVASEFLSESERSKSTKKETCFLPLYASRPGASGNNEDLHSHNTSHANDVETRVMARYQILKNREFSGEHNCPSGLFEFGTASRTSASTTKENDVETSVFGGYQILKGQDDTCDYLNYESQQSTGDENYLLYNDSTSPNKVFQDSQMSNSLGVVTDEREASVMARFRIIQSRMDQSNSMINDSALEDTDGAQQKCNIKKTTFGPYPELTDEEDVNSLNIHVNEKGVTPIVKTNRMSSVILEGWYDHDCCSSDWEHISSRDV